REIPVVQQSHLCRSESDGGNPGSLDGVGASGAWRCSVIAPNATCPEPFLRDAMSQPSRIILAGGTGFLGQILRRDLSAAGYEILVLTRSPSGPGEMLWNGRTLGTWANELEGSLALINLAGKSVNCRYSERN